ASRRNGRCRGQAVDVRFLDLGNLDAFHQIAGEVLSDGLSRRDIDAVEPKGGFVRSDTDNAFRRVLQRETVRRRERKPDHRMNEARAAYISLRRVVAENHPLYGVEEGLAVALAFARLGDAPRLALGKSHALRGGGVCRHEI